VNDSEAEQWFRLAIDSRPDSTITSLGNYAEWLIQQERYTDALQIAIPKPQESYYLHFLREVVFEKSGRIDEALVEYEIYRQFNQHFPAPAEMKIEDSNLQNDLKFLPTATYPNACGYPDPICLLAGVVHQEARSENVGGRRAVAWVARNRVFLGDVGEDEAGNTCVVAHNDGNTIVEKYQNVLLSGAFAPPADPDIDSQTAAYEVYYGNVPDPFSGYCPNPKTQYGGGTCSGYCVRWEDGEPIVEGQVSGGSFRGLVTFHAKNVSMASCDATRDSYNYPPFSCSEYQGYICDSSGDLGNCFYSAPLHRLYLPIVTRSNK